MTKSVDESALSEWGASFRPKVTAYSIESGMLVVRCRPSVTIAVPPGPSGANLRVRAQQSGQIELVLSEDCPASIFVDCEGSISQLVARGPASPAWYFDGGGGQTGLRLEFESIPSVELANGVFAAVTHIPASVVSVKTAHFKYAREESLDHLVVRGDVELSGGSLKCQRASIDGATLSVHQQGVRFETATTTGFRFAVGELSVGTLEASGPILLESKATLGISESLASGGGVPEFRGRGTVAVHVSMYRPVFSAVDSEVVRLKLTHRGARVEEATGVVRLAGADGAVCTGNPSEPLVLTEIETVSGSELVDVDVTRLSFQQIGLLEEVERLSPIPPYNPLWPTPGAGKRRKARDRISAGSTAPPSIAAKQRAHFWLRLLGVIEKKHASGKVRSEVRYASMRARRKSLEWSKEKFLLGAYSIVGYGERIIRPLLVFAGLCVAVAPMYLIGAFSWRRFTEAWVVALISPLTVFRAIDQSAIEGPWETLLATLLRTAGLVLIFFSATAARRVAKAE